MNNMSLTKWHDFSYSFLLSISVTKKEKSREREREREREGIRFADLTNEKCQTFSGLDIDQVLELVDAFSDELRPKSDGKQGITSITSITSIRAKGWTASSCCSNTINQFTPTPTRFVSCPGLQKQLKWRKRIERRETKRNQEQHSSCRWSSKLQLSTKWQESHQQESDHTHLLYMHTPRCKAQKRIDQTSAIQQTLIFTGCHNHPRQPLSSWRQKHEKEQESYFPSSHLAKCMNPLWAKQVKWWQARFHEKLNWKTSELMRRMCCCRMVTSFKVFIPCLPNRLSWNSWCHLLYGFCLQPLMHCHSWLSMAQWFMLMALLISPKWTFSLSQ